MRAVTLLALTLGLQLPVYHMYHSDTTSVFDTGVCVSYW